jgi:phospholipid/cholesterol/gamma-HCH transport system ATP-binding protein
MIELRDLHKELGGKPVLQGVDLTVSEGQTLVIVGFSGTGKSVTLQHIMGLMRPDRGDVLIDGVSVPNSRGRQLEQIRNRFGVLFQSGGLINWMTVGENIALPLLEKTDLGDDEIARAVRENLEVVELDGVERKMPSEISGGMRKRAALARAIIRRPAIVLYDEPTSGLDPVTSRKIDRLIRDLQHRLGVTSVVVTHDLRSAFDIGDQVALLHEGRIVELADPDGFRRSSEPLVQEFIRSQFG